MNSSWGTNRDFSTKATKGAKVFSHLFSWGQNRDFSTVGEGLAVLFFIILIAKEPDCTERQA
jgi:hypothetical protein